MRIYLPTGPSYDLGLDAATVLSGLFDFIGDNIVPILTIMGVITGLWFIVNRFNNAKSSGSL